MLAKEELTRFFVRIRHTQIVNASVVRTLYQGVWGVLCVLTNSSHLPYYPQIPVLQMVLDLMRLPLHHAKWQK